MSNIKGCLSNLSDDWRTPSILFNAFMDFGFRDCFPFHCSFNQFEHFYKGQRLFINPPFSKLDLVADYVISHLKNRCDIWLLMPSRTDTKYFHKLIPYVTDIFFFRGRLHFNDSKNGSPFPTICMRFCCDMTFRYKKITYGGIDDFVKLLGEYYG